VIGISRTLGKAEQLLLGGNFNFIAHDLSEVRDPSAYGKLIKMLDDFLRGDEFMLVFNAACFYSSSHRLNGEALATLFDLNLFSVMNLVRDLQLPGLRRVLFINSVSGLIGQKLQHEYTASKHALMGYARSLAQSAKNSYFDVMSVNPGGINTEMWRKYKSVDCSDFLAPETVADVCLALLMIPQRVFVESMAILPPSDL